MIFPKLFFTLLVLFLSFQICFGQESPKASLVDEFGKINCEMFDARMDGFLLTLQHTNAVGYVVILGDKNNPLEKYKRENLIKSYAIYRRFPNNLIFIHGKDQENIKTELWQVQSGVEKPNFEEQKWDYSLPPNIKSFILYSNYSYTDDDICPPASNEEFASRLLFSNPNINAHLVIYSNSVKKFQQNKNKLINEFTKKYKIPHNRLKVFSAKKTGDIDFEFWLVPKKKLN